MPKIEPRIERELATSVGRSHLKGVGVGVGQKPAYTPLPRKRK